MSRLNLLRKFNDDLEKVNLDRAAEYGHPADDFNRVSRLTTVIVDCKDPELRHVLYAICIKMARLVFNPGHFDSWLDIAGYAKCAIMILQQRADTKEIL